MISLDDLDQAMRDPGRKVPAIRRLGGGSLAVVAGGDAWRVLGRTSAIYALRRPTGRILALRVPLDDDPAALARLGDRYRALATDPALAPLRAAGGPLPGEIRWLSDAVTLPAAGFRSLAHPLLAMEFVPGGTLLQAVETAVTAGSGDTITAAIPPLVRSLVAFERARFGHGDLRPDNILLRRPDDLAFADLDRAAWPGSPGLPPGADPPARDRLPALLLLTELLALAWQPVLGAAGATADGRLLFGPDDLADAERSALLRRLRDADDPALAAAATLVGEALVRGGPGAPPFTEVAAAIGLLPERGDGARRGFIPAPAPAAGTPAQPGSGTGAPAGLPGWLPRTSGSAPTRQEASPPAHPIPPAPADAGGRQWGSEESRVAGGLLPPTASNSGVLDRAGRRATGASDALLPPNRGEPPKGGAWEGGQPPRPTPRAVPAAVPSPAEAAPLPLSAAERQKAITRLNSLLLASDATAAGRFWLDSGLASDPEAVRGVGPLLRTLGLPWAPAPDAARVPGERRDSSTLDERPSPPVPPEAVDALDRLLPALEAGDIGLVARFWPEARRDPRAGFLAARVGAALARDLGNRSRRAERLGDDAALARLPAEAKDAGVALPAETRRAARAAADREGRRARLVRAMAEGDRAVLAGLALAGLDDLGRLPPEVQKATERALAWPALERALAAGGDAAIVAAADPALFADDPLLPPATRAQIELAYARNAWLRSTRDALRHRDGAALRAALGSMPPGAEAGLSPTERRRIDRLARADAALARLGEALRTGSDTAIVDALAAVEETGAALPTTLDWGAIQDVASRVSLVRALREVAEGGPADALRLARLLPAARALLAAGAGSGLDGFDLDALERQVLRAAHLARLREALASGDDDEIAAAASPDLYGAIELLNAGERERVEGAVGVRG